MNTLSIEHEPTEDVTPELDPELALYYQFIIGVLQWMVELGQVDINMEILMLASHLAFLREGNFEAVFHVFSYLWENSNSRLELDITYPEIDHESFKKHKWVDFYGDVKETILADMP